MSSAYDTSSRGRGMMSNHKPENIQILQMVLKTGTEKIFPLVCGERGRVVSVVIITREMPLIRSEHR